MKTKLLIVALFFLIVGGLGGQEVDNFLLNSKIESNPSFTTATVIDHTVHSKSKRGVKTVTYNIQFVFNVDGKDYVNRVSLTNDSGKSAVKKGTIDIAYLESNPAINRLRGGFVSGNTTSDLVWMVIKIVFFGLVMAPFIGFILALKFGWIDLKPKDNEDESSLPEQETA